jgi:hypothetical protein
MSGGGGWWRKGEGVWESRNLVGERGKSGERVGKVGHRVNHHFATVVVLINNLLNRLFII